MKDQTPGTSMCLWACMPLSVVIEVKVRHTEKERESTDTLTLLQTRLQSVLHSHSTDQRSMQDADHDRQSASWSQTVSWLQKKLSMTSYNKTSMRARCALISKDMRSFPSCLCCAQTEHVCTQV